MGIRHQIGIKVGGDWPWQSSIALSRADRAFSDDERDRLAAIVRHLRRSHELRERVGVDEPTVPVLVEVGLTPRQAEVAIELARGGTNAQVARRLGLSVGTLRKHLQGVFAVLGVEDRASAVAATRRAGRLSGRGRDGGASRR